mmetsp:Transcript_11256/g.18399  ORF Transcript_11256/g.18399 Transcript_11256/m.18399 type:complete len:88 (-) Transcript_11256:706-969(-)
MPHTFSKKTAHLIFKTLGTNASTSHLPEGTRTVKLSNEGAEVLAEFLRLFVIEALHRSASTAQNEDEEQVEPRHLEQNVPQLLLDFT